MILKLLILLGAVIALSKGTYIKKRVVREYCATPWRYFKGHCYYFSTKQCSRAVASEQCRGKGACLVKISSKGEGIWLSNKARGRSKNFNKSYWIFPTCVKSTNNYKGRWSYGPKYRGWKNGQSGKGNCAALYCGYKWVNWKRLNCERNLLFICKKAAKENTDEPVLVIDEPFPADYSSESSGSGSSSGSKKGRKYNGNSSGGSKKGRKYYGKSSGGSKKGRKYYGKGGSKKGRKYYGKGGSKKGRKYYGKGGSKKGRKYYGKGGSKKGRKYYGKGGSKKGRKYYGKGGSKKGRKYYGKGGSKQGRKYYGKGGSKKGRKYYGKGGSKKGRKYYGKGGSKKGRKYYGKGGNKKGRKY